MLLKDLNEYGGRQTMKLDVATGTNIFVFLI